MKKKYLLILIISAFVILLFLFFIFKNKEVNNNIIESNNNDLEQNSIIDEKVDIIDLNSNSRPIAIVVNNSTAAVKVQTGLQEAYIVYEIPVEGGLTRLLALYKDINNLTIGTIRSARHNFLDYAFENDAFFVCYGWSHYAKSEMRSNGIDYVNGVVDSSPFWRDNPENLAVEHTAYTSMAKIREYVANHNIRMTSDEKTNLNYDFGDFDLSTFDNHQVANKIYIPSNDVSNTTYEYDSQNKVYKRFVNNNPNIDYYSKQQFTTKNIIIQKINTKKASDNYYWDLETTGTGDGYYITNGYAIPIKWHKETRKSKTYYTYLDGTELIISDGNTFIQLQSNNQKFTIE